MAEQRWRAVRGPCVGLACAALANGSVIRGLIATVLIIVAFQISEGK